MNKALVVGINTYEKQTALNGCLNDIADVTASLIERAAVKPADVVELADANATKKRILDELAGLVAALGSGDCGYFHVSGHGVRMRANDPQEPDGMDEAICPYEFDWTDDTAIRDNEVLEILAGLRLDARMVLVFDSCHSGDMSRFVAVPNSRPRTLPPPTGAYGTRGPTRNGFRAASRAPNIAFVSAVSPWQLAADTAFDGRSNGAFTYYFLRQANASAPGTSLTALVTAIEPELRPFEMTPVAEGGDAPFYQPVTTKRALPRSISLVRPVTLARVGAVVFDQAYHASLLGQELAVSVRI
jgi:metacaspase-1